MSRRRLKKFDFRFTPPRPEMPRAKDMPARGGYRSCSRTRILTGCCACRGGKRSHNWACGGRYRKKARRSGARCRRSSRIGFRHAF